MPVVHTVTRTITLNSTTYYPSTVEFGPDHGRQGVMHEADNGGVTQTITGTKKRYRYTWDRPNPTVFAALVALGSSTISVTDHNGASWTALIPIGSPSATITHGVVDSTAGTTYGFSCELWEV